MIKKKIKVLTLRLKKEKKDNKSKNKNKTIIKKIDFLLINIFSKLIFIIDVYLLLSLALYYNA